MKSNTYKVHSRMYSRSRNGGDPSIYWIRTMKYACRKHLMHPLRGESCDARVSGFTLIEVLIGLFILLLLIIPVALLMGSLFSSTAQSKIRTTASGIVTAQSECIKSLPTTDLSNGAPWVMDGSGISPTQTSYANSATNCTGAAGSTFSNTVQTVNYGNFVYKMEQDASLVVQNSSSSTGNPTQPAGNTCYGLGGDPQLLLQATSTAGWKQSGSDSSAFGQGYTDTRQSTLLTPPQIDVLVENLYGSPVPNTNVSLSGPDSPSGTTGSNGCVSFVNLSTGSYTVTATVPQVDTSGNPTGVSVTLSKQVTIDPASVIGLVFPADVNVPPPAPFSGQPTITSIQALPWMSNPGSLDGAFGPIAGGNQVFIFGHNFSGVSLVQFGSTDASFSVQSCSLDPHPNSAPCPSGENYYISAIVPGYPSQTGGTVYVTATAFHNGNTYTSNSAQYSYWNQPYIYSVGSPDSADPGGQNIKTPGGTPWGGTRIVLDGFNLQYATEVDMCMYPTDSWNPCTAVKAAFTVNSNTQITATTPTDWFSCSVLSDFGYCSGWDLITGSLINYAAVTVTATVSDASGSQSMTSNPDSNGSNSDCPNESPVTLGSGSSTSSSQNVTCHFLYAFPPVITSLNPSSGPVSGGNTVYICGSNFHASGPGQITQVNWGSTAIGTSGFQVITQNYSATTYPYVYNNTPCGEINAVYPRSVTYIKVNSVPPAPGGSASSVQVSVQNAVGAVSNSVTYTYLFPPSISSFSPQGGGIGGVFSGAGTQVDIYGQHLSGVSTVNFGCAGNASYNVISSTEIQATAPNSYYWCGTGAAQVNITVSNSVGSSSDGPYTYENSPSISSISPNGGIFSGGTTVTVCGSRFYYATSVWFGSSKGSSFAVHWQGTSFSGPCGGTLIGYHYITVTSPYSPNGGNDSVGVFVHDKYIAYSQSGSPNNCDPSGWPGGESCNSGSFTYTYTAPPSISSVSPTSYSHCTAGGVVWPGIKYWGWCTINFSVTISGSSFNNITSVYVGGVSASYTVVNSGQINASVSYTGYGWDARICLPSGTVQVSNNAGSSSWGTLSCN